MILTASQMLCHGLQLVGTDVEMQSRRLQVTNINDFRAHYGPHPVHAARIWRDIQNCEQSCPEAYVNPDTADIDAFFWGLEFLRLYQTESVRASRFKVGKQTVREKSWYYIKKICALKAIKIVMPAAGDWRTVFIISVDGAHFLINEPRDPRSR